MSEAARRVAIYSQESSRPTGQVVGPAGPISWPNGLPIFLMLSCFVVKQNICSFGASFSVDMTRMAGGEMMEVIVVVEWRWR
jgi:hypothetical protein